MEREMSIEELLETIRLRMSTHQVLGIQSQQYITHILSLHPPEEVEHLLECLRSEIDHNLSLLNDIRETIDHIPN